MLRPMVKTVDRIKQIWHHPANRGHQFQTFLRVLSWQLYKRLFNKSRDFKVFNDSVKIRCYPDCDAAALAVYFNGHPYYFIDFHEMGFIQKYLRSGDRVLDIGANLGAYTLLMASIVNSSGHVESFEAHPKTASRLTENVKLNHFENRVKIHNLAVGSENSSLFFTDFQFSGENHIVEKVDKTENSNLIEVPCVRLDDVLQRYNYMFGKMDIEGFELYALQGAEEHIKQNNPPVWLIEVNQNIRKFGLHENDLCKWLINHNYKLALYDVFKHELNFCNNPWEKRINILAIAKDFVPEVLLRLGSDLQVTYS